MKKTLDVICLGAAIVDIPLQPVSRDIFDIESYPVNQIAMVVGGDAMNEATIIRRLGFRTGIISCIGADVAGQFILNACQRDDIDAEGIQVVSDIDTSINIGLVTADGERTFITNRNGSLWKTDMTHVNLQKMKQAHVLSLASIFNNPLLDGAALCSIFSAAKQADMTICADMVRPRLQETLSDIRTALGYLDYFFPNQEEAHLITGQETPEGMADALYDCGIKNVVIKMGRAGCCIRNSQGIQIIPAIQGITALDTIGAGDNFVSGFIASLLQGKALRECAIYANCTAAVSIGHIGATAGVQNRVSVDAMREKYRVHYGE